MQVDFVSRGAGYDEVGKCRGGSVCKFYTTVWLHCIEVVGG